MRSRASRHTLAILAALAILWGSSALAQSTDPVDGQGNVIQLVDGPVTVVPSFDLPLGTGLSAPNLSPDSPTTTASPSLAFYTANYLSLGAKQLPFHIVGTDPSLGANTTTIPVVLVPLKFIFPNAGNPTLDGSNVITSIQNSPIFQTADYTVGSVDLGVTQFGDALQRAQFWNVPGFSNNYHVLLGTPSVAPTITLSVPAGEGNAFALSAGGFMGVLDTDYFNSILAGLIGSYTADRLPIFVTDNVYLGAKGLSQNCCILGFHSSQGPPIATARTWIYAAYAEPGTFAGSQGGVGFVDVVPLSHELSEWLNDPFVGAFTFNAATNGLNLVAPAVLPGQGGACIFNFETGDPLEAAPFTFSKVTNGTTYHLQDEVTLPWYLHTTPSFSVNGFYTFQNLSATIPLVINSPASIAGSYTDTATLTFAPVNASVTGNVAYVGRGCPAGSISAGSPADPYLSDPSGKIALIDRGGCAISLKIDRAAKAGATGVLIGLVAPGSATSFTYGGGSSFVPSLVITQAVSTLIKNALASAIVNATISPANALPAPFSSLCGPG